MNEKLIAKSVKSKFGQNCKTKKTPEKKPSLPDGVSPDPTLSFRPNPNSHRLRPMVCLPALFASPFCHSRLLSLPDGLSLPIQPFLSDLTLTVTVTGPNLRCRSSADSDLTKKFSSAAPAIFGSTFKEIAL